MNKFINFVEHRLMPLTYRISNNRYILALRDGMVVSMPVMIVGSMLLVIAEFPVVQYQDWMASVFGEGWKWFSDAGTSATIGLAAIFAIIGISTSLAESKKQNTTMAIITSLMAYFTILVQITDGGFMVSSFNARGLFAAIIVSMISTEIYCFVLEKDYKIKMPESVPLAIAKSFEALIPAFVIVLFFLVVRFGFSLTAYESLHNFVLKVLQIPLTGLTSSYGGILIATLMSHFLWFFGIHGASVVGAVAGPMWQASGFENFEAFKANMPLPNIITQQFNDIFQTYGGVGSTLLMVAIMAWLCKSKQMRTLGKLAIVPSLFGINEPVVFGLPLMLNPILMIPFFLTPIINVSLAYFATLFGLIGRTTGVQVTWSMPPILSGFLGTNDIRAAVLQVVAILISGLIYYPFVMAYDKRLLEHEQGLLEGETLEN